MRWSAPLAFRARRVHDGRTDPQRRGRLHELGIELELEPDLEFAPDFAAIHAPHSNTAHDRAPNSTYASSTTTTASGVFRARSTIRSGSTHDPTGLFGLQIQWRSAASSGPVTSAPRSVVAIR